MPTKPEWPALYAPGFHEATLSDLRNRCVDAFPLSKRRDPIMRSLEAMCFAISGALLRAEVWVNGSFTTFKIEPDDVDVVVVFNEPSGGGTPDQLSVIRRVEAQDFQFPVKCDSYTCAQYPEGHKLHSTSEFMRAYWMRQFGFSRGNALKGIALVRTPVS